MCNCRKEVNDALDEFGAQLAFFFPLSNEHGEDEAVIIKTEAKPGARRKNVPALFSTFCPFCGEKHDKSGEEAKNVTN